LHAFISSAGARLSQDDKLQVYEAIAHVISAMPMEQAAVSLQTFSNDLLLLVHGMAEKVVPPSAQDIKEVCGMHRIVRQMSF
jgi:transportin-3